MIEPEMESAAVSRSNDQPGFMESAYSPRMGRWFSIVVKRMFRRQFATVRAAKGSLDLLGALNPHDGPAIVALNHSSWWDPLVCVLLASIRTPARTHAAPMDIDQLRRFRFMRKIGLFGIEPDDPRSLPRMLRHVSARFRREPRCTLWITPQGEFRDVRDGITLRPGVGAAAATASEAGEVPVLALAIEYTFWEDKRPEVFLRIARVSPPDAPSRSGRVGVWTDQIQRAMRENQAALAAMVAARDPRPFELVLGGAGGANHPLYDVWLRLRGRHGRIVTRRGSQAAAQGIVRSETP